MGLCPPAGGSWLAGIILKQEVEWLAGYFWPLRPGFVAFKPPPALQANSPPLSLSLSLHIPHGSLRFVNRSAFSPILLKNTLSGYFSINRRRAFSSLWRRVIYPVVSLINRAR